MGRGAAPRLPSLREKHAQPSPLPRGLQGDWGFLGCVVSLSSYLPLHARPPACSLKCPSCPFGACIALLDPPFFRRREDPVLFVAKEWTKLRGAKGGGERLRGSEKGGGSQRRKEEGEAESRESAREQRQRQQHHQPEQQEEEEEKSAEKSRSSGRRRRGRQAGRPGCQGSSAGCSSPGCCCGPLGSSPRRPPATFPLWTVRPSVRGETPASSANTQRAGTSSWSRCSALD